MRVGVEEIKEEVQRSAAAAALEDPQALQAEATERGQRGGEGEVIAIHSSKSLDVWTLYLYAMKSPMTREKYQRRFIKFLDFLGKVGNEDHNDGLALPQKSNTFAQKVKFAQKDLFAQLGDKNQIYLHVPKLQ